MLRRPMHILTSLSLHNFEELNADDVILHKPLLKCLEVVSPKGTPLPSFRRIRWLTVVEPVRLFQRTFDPKYAMVEDASDLEELVIKGNFSLPPHMPKLWRLEAAGDITWSNNPVDPLPKLTHLVLKGHHFNWLEALVNNGAIDLSHLTSFGVHWVQDIRDSPTCEAVMEVLQAAKGLSNIHGNTGGISLVLRLIWKSEMAWNTLSVQRGYPEKGADYLLGGQRISVTAEKGSRVLRGDETCIQLCEVARELNVQSPNDPP